MAISSLLNISRDALMTYQGAISVTGSNIANVNNADYTVQRATISARTQLSSFQAGTGVDLTSVTRVYDQYIGNRIIDETSNSGYWDTRSGILGQVEVLYDETDTAGLTKDLEAFWDSWSDLAQNPTGLVEQNAVVAASDNLASNIRDKYQSLQTILAGVNESIAGTVNSINSLAADIAELNRSIVSASNSGAGVNELIDKRDAAIRSLSELIPVQTVADESGSVSVFLANGQMLVSGISSRELEVGATGDVTFKGNTTPLDSLITGGKLGALLELRDETLPGYMNSLDTLAAAVITEVNTLHGSGVDQTGAAVTGRLFFASTPVGSSAAFTMSVASGILSDPTTIVASQTVAGDGAVASAITALQNQGIVTSGTQQVTTSEYWASSVSTVAKDISLAGQKAEQSAAVMTQLESQRANVSGVSLDEEMIYLIQYQLGYSAAGQLCGTAQEMLDTLMGLVQ
ncbi:MAG TPA: flagellar hook-associated protein FlgK [Syntrophales bacterium]|nr:flagellar hook-associated protein FlgK [Syntrophales bacterium]